MVGSRSFAGGALALLLLTGAAPGSASAAEGGLLSGFKLPGIFGSEKQTERKPSPSPAPVQLAQGSDPRVTALEEQVRRLSGTIEEMNFQILQMQEQMRKQQEDLEFRLQELEGGGTTPSSGKKSDAGDAANPAGGKTTRAVANVASEAPAEQTVASTGAALPAGADAGTGQPQQPLGTITFDASGNVTGGSVGDQTVVSRGSGAATDGTVVAALPHTDDPEELYGNAYEFILSGDYATAEAGFRDHIARFPKDARAADAQFWLGEALLGQEKFRDAAEVFLAASKAYPKSRKAPDMLLKLGVSLNGMNQHDVACATFGEVEKRYPAMSSALKSRLKQERALAAC